MHLNLSKLNLLSVGTVLVLLFFSPFFLPFTFKDPFDTGPQIWLYLVTGTGAVFLGTVTIFLYRNTRFIDFNLIDFSILASLVWVMICSLSQRETYFSNDLINYCCLTGLYLMVRFNLPALDSANLRRLSLIVTVFASLFVLLAVGYGVLQMFRVLPSNNDDFIVTGMFKNPARYGNYLNTLAPLLLTASLFFPTECRYDKLIKNIAGISFVIAIGGIGLSYTRAAWIGACCGALLILYYRFPTWLLKKSTRIWLAISILVIAVSVGIILFRLKPVSAQGRLTVWEISKGIVRDNPGVGIGYGNFKSTYNNYQAKYFAEKDRGEAVIQRADTVRYAYNVLLQVLAEEGIVGLALFLLLVFALFPCCKTIEWDKNRFGKLLWLTGAAGVFATLTSGLFSYPLSILPVQIIFFIMISLVSGLKHHLPSENKGKPKIRLNLVFIRVFGALGVACGILLICLAWYRYGTYQRWAALFDSDSAKLETLYPALKYDNDYLANYGATLVREKKYAKALNVLVRGKHLFIFPSDYQNLAQAYEGLGQLDLAEYYYRFAINMVPNRLYSRYLLAEFYYSHCQVSKSRTLLNEILTAKIKIQSYIADDVLYKAKSLLLKCDKQPK